MSQNTAFGKEPTKKDYIIDLNKIYENQPNQDWESESYRKDDGSMSLHQNLAAKLTRNIWRGVHDNNESCKQDWEPGWTNLNFFISGGRGSGKSTFLRYVSRCITRQASPFQQDEEPPTYAPRIEKLLFCDPTAMTSNENFFISILAALRDWIRKKTNQGIIDKSYGIHSGGERQLHYAELEKIAIEKLNELSRGIRQLNGGSSSSLAELDLVSQLNMGMSNSSSALHLREKFYRFVNWVASNYNTDAFLIAIDDADIEFTKNKLIIEIIRTYITHPRLIILFTGDPILIHEAIREKQFSQFGIDFHKADVVTQSRRWELTDAMTAQYLKKIFPPSNHLHLLSLYDAIKAKRNSTFKVRFYLNDKSDDKVIKDMLFLIFRHSLVEDDEQALLLREGFLRMPLRSILHTLRYWNDRGMLATINRLEQLREEKMTASKEQQKNEITEEEERMREEISYLLAKSFRSAFGDELLSLGFTKKDLEMSSPYQLARGLLLHCFKSKDLSYGHRLVTSGCRHDTQETSLFLAAKEKVVVKDFGDALSFVLFGVFTVHAFRYYQQTSLVKNTQPNIASYDHNKVQQYLQHKQQEFIDYLFSSNNEDPLRWTRKLSLIFLNNNEQNSISADGRVQPYLSHGVYYLSDRNDVELINQIIINQLTTIRKDNEDEQKRINAFMVYLLTIISCGQASNHQNVYYLSAYNIFGFILKCFTLCKDIDSQTPFADEERTKAVDGFIRTFIKSYIRANDMPTWANGFISPHECSNIRKNVLEKLADGKLIGEELIRIIAHKIVDWYHLVTKKTLRPSAPMLGQAADAIYRTICNICNDLRSVIHNDTVGSATYYLHNIFHQLDTHIKLNATSNQDKNAEKTLAGCLTRFPLCNEESGIFSLIKNAAQSALKEANVASRISEKGKALAQLNTENLANIHSLQDGVEPYFIQKGTGRKRHLFFEDKIEDTIENARTLHPYFSRILRLFQDSCELAKQYRQEGRLINQPDPEILAIFQQQLKSLTEQCKLQRKEIVNFRKEIRHSFIEGLKNSIHNKKLHLEQKLTEQGSALASILNSIQTERNRYPSGARIKISALTYPTKSVAFAYFSWKHYFEDENAAISEAHSWITRMQKDAHMINFHRVLRISTSEYSQFFHEFTRLTEKTHTHHHTNIIRNFREHAEFLKSALTAIQADIVESKEKYKMRIMSEKPFRQLAARQKILEEIEQQENELTQLQKSLHVDADSMPLFKATSFLSAYADFEAEFGLRSYLYNVFIALHELRNKIDNLVLPIIPSDKS